MIANFNPVSFCHYEPCESNTIPQPGADEPYGYMNRCGRDSPDRKIKEAWAL